MQRYNKNGLEVLQFESKGFNGFIQGVFTRKGGVSEGQWASLNQGSTVGDLHENVMENRKRAFDFFKRDINSLFDVWQVHGNEIVCTDTPRKPDEPHIKADAIFTNNPDLTLFMRFADCVPIIVCDPIKGVAGIIHAGWKGTVNDIVGDAIKKIKMDYGVDPKNLVAGIGPSIGPDHYVVGDEVVHKARDNFGSKAVEFLIEKNGSISLDLWAANAYLLRRQGVEDVECANICTACNLDDWYSHRKENGKTGRFGALIAIQRGDK